MVKFKFTRNFQWSVPMGSLNICAQLLIWYEHWCVGLASVFAFLDLKWDLLEILFCFLLITSSVDFLFHMFFHLLSYVFWSFSYFKKFNCLIIHFYSAQWSFYICIYCKQFSLKWWFICSVSILIRLKSSISSFIAYFFLI